MAGSNSDGSKRDELGSDELHAVSGGSVQIREVIIKAAVATVHTAPPPAAPGPVPMPYPNLGTKV